MRECTLKKKEGFYICKIERPVYVSMDSVDNLLDEDLVQVKIVRQIDSLETKLQIAEVLKDTEINWLISYSALGDLIFLVPFYIQIYTQPMQIKVIIVVRAWKYPSSICAIVLFLYNVNHF